MENESSGPVMGKLIDLSDEEPEPAQGLQRSTTDTLVPTIERKVSAKSTKSPPPLRPNKPLALRSSSGQSQATPTQEPSSSSPGATRKIPPPPPKPRKSSTTSDTTSQPTDPSPLSQTQNSSPPKGRASSVESQSYGSTVRSKVTSAYNAIPSPTSYWNGTAAASADAHGLSSSNASKTEGVAPPVPPRRALTSYPAAAAHYASNRASGLWNSAGTTNESGAEDFSGNTNAAPPVNKKEEMWRRRWARARDVLEDKGVLLRSWRFGGDVMDEAVGLVEKALKERVKAGGKKETKGK